MTDFNITRIGHAEFRVTNLDRAKKFYVDALGMMVIDDQKDALYLGCYEERDKYSLILRKADSPGVSHVAFRVANESDLEVLEKLHIENDLQTRWIEPNTLEAGQGRALRVQDPMGLPIEFYHEIEQRERLLQKFELHRGAHIMRIDHTLCQVRDVQAAYDWWTKSLGFYLSEATVSDNDPDVLIAAWLHRKQSVHDFAITAGLGPRLHHVAFWCQDTQSILRACDILASMGMRECIERGPGRHGLSNAFFLYLRDPDGNRIELYTSDYIIADPDFEPLKWRLSDPQRATFWGHRAPDSWFEESMAVENIHTGEFMPTEESLQSSKPDFVT